MLKLVLQSSFLSYKHAGNGWMDFCKQTLIMYKLAFILSGLLAWRFSSSILTEAFEGNHAWICQPYHGANSLFNSSSNDFINSYALKVSVKCKIRPLTRSKWHSLLLQPLHYRWIRLLPMIASKWEASHCVQNEYIGGTEELAYGLKLHCLVVQKPGFYPCPKISSKLFIADPRKSFPIIIGNDFLQSVKYRKSPWKIKLCDIQNLKDVTLKANVRNELEISIIVLDNFHVEFTSSASNAGTGKLPFDNEGLADYDNKRRQHRIVSRSVPREQVVKLPTQQYVHKSDGFPKNGSDEAGLVRSHSHSLSQSHGTSRMSKRQMDDSLIERVLHSSMTGDVGNDFFEPEVPALKTDMDLLEEKGDRPEPQAGVEYINLNAELATGGIDDQPIHSMQEKPALLKPGLLV